MRRVASVLVLASLGGCSLYFDDKDSSSTGIPVVGGTLLVTRDGTRAIAADPDNDRILVVDLAAQKLASEIALQPGDEPGRVIEDGAGRIHVALRRGGAIVTLDTFGTAIADRRAVCPAPRGLAYEVGTDSLHVACATGELVTLPAVGGAITRTIDLQRDLRDVVVIGDQLVVTRFRTAEVIRLRSDGTEISRGAPPSPLRDSFNDFGEFDQVPARASVAYRTIVAPNGSLVMVHQRALSRELSTDPGGYGGGGCDRPGPVEATATVFDPAATTAVVSRAFKGAQLPVDVALSPTGDRIAVVNAGSRTLRLVWLSSLQRGETMNPCDEDDDDDTDHDSNARYGMPKAVSFTPDNTIVVQHDFAIVLRDTYGDELASIRIGNAEEENLGRRRFHQPTFSGLACASCHPEGHEDGLVWEFDTLGQRRTQDIGGNLADRQPYHWSGDMHSVDQLLDEVLVGRMGGEPLTDAEAAALPQFLFSLKAMPSRVVGLDTASISRGREVFDSSGCATCHNGPAYTNNAIVNVGTGGSFKVPSLVAVGARAPFIHTGCAATLRDRFSTCGGGTEHGVTANLTPAQLDDLVVFLESL